MRKLSFFLFFFISVWSIGQQSITDKVKTQLQAGGPGVAYFNIDYTAGSYTSRERDIVSASYADSSTIVYSVHIIITDTLKTKTDTNFTLTSSQVSLLNSFYQSAGNGSNPDPAISTAKTGASGTLLVTLYSRDVTDVTYTTAIHISLGRYLLSNWTNWN